MSNSGEWSTPDRFSGNEVELVDEIVLSEDILDEDGSVIGEHVETIDILEVDGQGFVVIDDVTIVTDDEGDLMIDETVAIFDEDGDIVLDENHHDRRCGGRCHGRGALHRCRRRGQCCCS